MNALRRPAFACRVLLIGGILAASRGVGAVQTRTWTESAPELQRGNADGVAITSRGRLFLAPSLTRVGESILPGEPAQIWSAASDAGGNVYLGTGPDGHVLKVTPSGKTEVFFTVDEPLVTALAALPGGGLLAGTAPEGKIYRIDPKGRGEVWSETGERYVWSIAVTAKDEIYAGTGEQGIIFRIDRAGKASLFFDSDESHIVALSPLPDGRIMAGGAGRGLLYRIDADGRALVLHDDELPEVRSIVVEPDGGIVVALVAPPAPEPRPPAVRIQVAAGAVVGAAPEAMGEIEGRPGQTLQGIIEGLPPSAEERDFRLRGRIVRILTDGSSQELWRSSTDAPFALALDAKDQPLFGTGEPARLYRVESGGEIALLASLREAQVTEILAAGGSLVVASSNPASLYRLSRDRAEAGVYVSRPLDAGGFARWGTLRWRDEEGPAAGRVEMFTRTGNSADPDGTWSAWSPALTRPSGSPIPNPPGRFFQWQARLVEVLGKGPRISSPLVTYLPQNRPPSLRDLRLEGNATSFSGKVPLRWSQMDPDGDPLAVEIQFRAQGATAWTTGSRIEPLAKPDGASDAESSWREGKGSWDAAAAPEGLYDLRVSASDSAANPPEVGRETPMDLLTVVAVDRTPPSIEARRTSAKEIEVVVRDAISAIARLEVVEDGKSVHSVLPEDGVCDGPEETFRLARPAAAGEGSRVLRAVDAAGNASEQPLPSSP